MGTQDIAATLQRAERALSRRPELGLHDDAPGRSRWDGGVRMINRHANGREVITDMPAELGGTGQEVSPGWMFRSGLAACTATSIAMAAASAGVALEALEVEVTSRSDTRGLLGMAEVDGAQVAAGPREIETHVRIAAGGVPAERLQAIVEAGRRRSPMLSALQASPAMGWRIEIGATA